MDTCEKATDPLEKGHNCGTQQLKPTETATPEVPNIPDISLRQAALIAGLGYLVVFIFGFANVRRDKLIARGDAAATADNIVGSESLFRAGVASWIVMLAADVVVAWALYVFLKPVSESLSLLTAWVRLV